MKTKGLRLGNYVEDIRGHKTKVISISTLLINEEETFCFNPIYVDDSVLLRCNAVKVSSHSWRLPAPDSYLDDVYIHLNKTGGFQLHSESHYLYLSRQKSFLHDLQNLYYMVYDSELDIDWEMVVPEIVPAKKWNEEVYHWFKRILKLK